MQNRTKHVLQQTVGVGLHPLERGTVGSRRLKRLLEESGFCLDDDELELLGHHCWQRGRIQKSRTIGWYPKHSVNPEREHQQHRLNKFVFNNYLLFFKQLTIFEELSDRATQQTNKAVLTRLGIWQRNSTTGMELRWLTWGHHVLESVSKTGVSLGQNVRLLVLGGLSSNVLWWNSLNRDTCVS